MICENKALTHQVEERKGVKVKWPSEQVSIEDAKTCDERVNLKKRKFDEFNKQGI